MQIKLLVRFTILVFLVLTIAHCRQAKQPLLTCDVGDPTCDFDSEPTSGKGKGGGDSRPNIRLGKNKNETPQTPEETKPDEKEEPEKTPDESEEITEEDGDREEEPITAVQSGITVSLVLDQNNKDGVLFHLLYEPFENVTHEGFFIGDSKDGDPVEHSFTNTNFAKKVNLSELRIPVAAEYSHTESIYCANFKLSKQISLFRHNLKEKLILYAVSSEGGCVE